MIRILESLSGVSKGSSDDEFSENSSFDEMIGGSNSGRLSTSIRSGGFNNTMNVRSSVLTKF